MLYIFLYCTVYCIVYSIVYYFFMACLPVCRVLRMRLRHSVWMLLPPPPKPSSEPYSLRPYSLRCVFASCNFRLLAVACTTPPRTQVLRAGREYFNGRCSCSKCTNSWSLGQMASMSGGGGTARGLDRCGVCLVAPTHPVRLISRGLTTVSGPERRGV